MRIPLVVGNSISIIAIVLTLYIATALRDFQNPIRFPILLLCWFSMLYFTHCISHYIVGRILGIEFSHYRLSKSMLSKANLPIVSKLFSAKVFLTLIIKKRKSGSKMFAMFISGPLASMFSPLVVVAISYGFDKTSAAILLVLTVINATFSGYYSYRLGCIRKGINSLKNICDTVNNRAID